jgi:hypothetical protein
LWHVENGTCRVAEDDGVTIESLLAGSQRIDHGGVDCEGIRESESIVLVEDNALEAMRSEPGPVEGSDGRDICVRKHEAAFPLRNARTIEMLSDVLMFVTLGCCCHPFYSPLATKKGPPVLGLSDMHDPWDYQMHLPFFLLPQSKMINNGIVY